MWSHIRSDEPYWNSEICTLGNPQKCVIRWDLLSNGMVDVLIHWDGSPIPASHTYVSVNCPGLKFPGIQPQTRLIQWGWWSWLGYSYISLYVILIHDVDHVNWETTSHSICDRINHITSHYFTTVSYYTPEVILVFQKRACMKRWVFNCFSRVVSVFVTSCMDCIRNRIPRHESWKPQAQPLTSNLSFSCEL